MSKHLPSRLARVFVDQKTSVQGLSHQEATRRLTFYGTNQIEETGGISPFKILLTQFNSFLVWLLFGAFILSYLIGERVDALVIVLVLVLNAVIGFLQEYKAEKAIAQLRKLEAPVSRVRREGKIEEVPSNKLVPGDVVLLAAGNRVPADGELIESHQLAVDESLLTGESAPVDKSQAKDTAVFAGTTVVRGRAEMVITKTGMKTNLGHIAKMVQTTQRSLTPLQHTLERLGKALGLLSILMATPALILGIWLGRDLYEIFLMSISLAVSAIPEGLPIVVTVTLAVGVQKMVKKQVLIRKLSAVETLGSTDIILTDKTGTITLNQMKATHIWTLTLGDIKTVGMTKTQKSSHVNRLIAAVALHCNDATPELGSPTELALLELSQKLGLSVDDRKNCKRLDEVAFTSKNKYMMTLHQEGKRYQVYAKGAPERILDFADYYYQGREMVRLTAEVKKKIAAQLESYAKQGRRVLAFSCQEIKKTSDFKSKRGHVFLGLVALMDPPRSRVRSAVAKCKRAGIRVVMLTGDHPLTAQSIASQVGIASEKVMTGPEFAKLTEEKAEQIVNEIDVFARVSPRHKLEILEILQSQGHRVAMTGDGVNDAPALKKAHVGVAVGSGSDLAREVADMIILDDDFASIVVAIHEGRGIFFNIKKFVKFLIAVNFDEIFLIAFSIFLGLPLPMLPIHLLWLNLVTDSLPALALAVDPYEPGLMKLAPYDPKREILHGVVKFSVVAGVLALVASLTAFITEFMALAMPLNIAQTATFTVTVLFELIIVFSLRSQRMIIHSKPGQNKLLIAAVALAVVLQFSAIYLPPFQTLLKTSYIPLNHWPFIITLSSIGLIGSELIKLLKAGDTPKQKQSKLLDKLQKYLKLEPKSPA